MSKKYFSNQMIALAGLSILAVSILPGGNFLVTSAQAALDDATVVVLTQTGCQFLESEKRLQEHTNVAAPKADI